ncbi:MAG: hypothetical protein LBL15_00350 [Oscillospiraceae bacterium]|jgi:hypothetical protein|nr:hypothetical protein [Oscillospiraceae bacterium]
MTQDIQTRLSAPFDDSDIEWRLQWVNDEKTSGIAVPYVTNRAIQARLDGVVGIGGWKNAYIPWHGDAKKQAQLCGIAIYFEDKKEWITKYDGAEDSDIEPVKGGLSDSMKRAAVQWGVGRYLYEMDSVYVDAELRGKTPAIKRSAQGKLNEAHRQTVKKVFGTAPDLPETCAPAKAPPRQEQAPITAPETQEGVYCIVSAVAQPGVSGSNTNLKLRDANGEVVQAYMRGTDPAIAAGARIRGAVISQKTKEGVVFNTLDAFTLCDPAASKAA